MISQEAFDQMKEDFNFHNCDDVSINLWYPQSHGRPKGLIVGLMDVRFAEDIRISYDFDRNGWVIEKQATIPFGDWFEAAFVPGGEMDNVVG